MDFKEECESSQKLWPGYDGASAYQEFVKTSSVKFKYVGTDTFLSQIDAKLHGQGSWSRLCHEFMFTLLHRRVRLVDEVDKRSCHYSSYYRIEAGAEEIVSKLAEHRCEDSVNDSCQVFVHRMDNLITRDLGQVKKKLLRRWLNEEVDLACDNLRKHMEKAVESMLSKLQARLGDLRPFHHVIKNGRVPLETLPVRLKAFDNETGNAISEERVKEQLSQLPSTLSPKTSQKPVIKTSESGPYMELSSELGHTLEMYSNLVSESAASLGAVFMTGSLRSMPGQSCRSSR